MDVKARRSSSFSGPAGSRLPAHKSQKGHIHLINCAILPYQPGGRLQRGVTPFSSARAVTLVDAGTFVDRRSAAFMQVMNYGLLYTKPILYQYSWCIYAMF
jgi:hypothetical protein